ncbi:MAG: spermidine/putrescine transport system ATP-binding protein [Actinomycetota bacterium]|jgi:spermidine/putrescine transport system ATP-binding protein|nr:spermidine/putrescine transport system ATP-binding protein [Actinomycetota bacterium]
MPDASTEQVRSQAVSGSAAAGKATAAHGGGDLRMRSLTKRFGTFTAVDDLDLVIPQGSFFALLGPSGCGKTTTLRMVAGLEEPTAGTISIGEEDITATRPYKRPVNTVFQNYALFPHLDIFENVAFGLRRRGSKNIKEQVNEALELVELAQMGRRKPGQLSGGQQQRVALARAIVNRPSVLLLDEPLGALDLKLRRQMQIELKRIQTEVGLTFVHVTHDQEEAMTMADTIAVMNEGRIEQMGGPTDLYENPTTTFVANFLGQSNLVRAKVTSRGSDVLEVEAEGQAFTLPTRRSFSDSDEIWFGVRPEKLSIGQGDAAEGLRGVITDTSFIGVSTQYLVRLPWGQEITAVRQNDGAPILRPGEQVTLTWDPRHAFALDASQDAHAGEDFGETELLGSKG